MVLAEGLVWPVGVELGRGCANREKGMLLPAPISNDANGVQAPIQPHSHPQTAISEIPLP